MKMRAALTPLLLCAALLAACGGGAAQVEVNGLITQVQRGEDGGLDALVVQTGTGEEVGLLLTGEGIWTQAEFQAALRPDTAVRASRAGAKTSITTADGTEVAAYKVNHMDVTGRLERGAAALEDGTPIDIFEEGTGFAGFGPTDSRDYRLADGTELLRVRTPAGPERHYVSGVENFDALGQRARERILDYYEGRGPLYDEERILERMYALYQELGADFQDGLVEQTVSPCGASGRVMYFLTSVTLPTGRGNGNMCYDIRLCDAFNRETGARIDPWELFSAPRDRVAQTILDAAGVTDSTLRAEMERAFWDGALVLSPDGLEFWLNPPASGVYSTGFALDYTPEILDLMWDWAVPDPQE